MSKLLNTIKGIIPMGARDLDEALEMGMDWSLREGYVWAEDKVVGSFFFYILRCVDISPRQEHCEEYGRMLNADPSVVSTRAKKRGLPQLGTLGAGNHYAEIQVGDEEILLGNIFTELPRSWTRYSTSSRPTRWVSSGWGRWCS